MPLALIMAQPVGGSGWHRKSTSRNPCSVGRYFMFGLQSMYHHSGFPGEICLGAVESEARRFHWWF